MRLFVFAPGTLGSGLRRPPAGEEVWPPGANGTFKSRTGKQLKGDLIPTEVIEKVCGMSIYSTISDLFAEAGVRDLKPGVQQEGLLRFPYDWRQNVEIEAGRLADRLDQVTSPGDEIVLVGHSMGTLVIRLMIEAERFKAHACMSRITKFVSINGPLLGAPIMIARALALEPTQFIKWADQKALLATSPFSGAYSLMPAPGRNQFFNGTTPIDLYDPFFYRHFGLGDDNMVAAKAMWTQLEQGERKARISYVLLSSLLDDKRTIERVAFIDGAWQRIWDAGDGAVPPWSSSGLKDALKPEPIAGEHRGMIDTREFRDLFHQHIAPLPPAAAAVGASLQPLKQQVKPGGVAEFAVVREGVGGAEGVLTWTPLTEQGTIGGSVALTTHLAVPPTAAPIIATRTPDRPGLYAVTLALDGVKARARIGVRADEEAPAQGPAAPA